METVLTSRRTARALALSTLALAPVLLAAACSSGSPTAVNPSSAVKPRISHARLYAYPDHRLYDTAAQLKAHGNNAVAAGLLAIARTPAAIWAAGQQGEMQIVGKVTLAGMNTHAVPVIVAYNMPGRDVCGKFSSTSGPGQSGYKRWINQLAAAIGTGHDIVIVEPDALPDLVRGCLNKAQAAERYQLLRYAMSRLGGLPHAQVYLDAGNPGMFANPAQLAGPLVQAGIRYGRGFSANVSNFEWTDTMVTWSQELEAALGGGVGAVIDTSRNGNGPYTGPETPQWCNPPGRAPGPAPEVSPGPAGIDAYLWIKDPGVSDGPCNGGPAAGQYWPAYAEELAQVVSSRSGGVT
jgi:endoglucanase